jgi:iron(III) transport system permease protein
VGALALVGYPLVDLFRYALSGPGGLDGAWRTITTSQVGVALLHTVVVSALAAVAACVIGVAMALLIGRSDLPLRRFFAGAWLAPLVIPPYVSGIAWLDAYTRAGLTDKVAHVSAGWLSGPGGVVLLLSLQGAPLVYLLAAAALRSERIGTLEDAARSAGSTPGRVLFDVTIPLMRTAIVGAMLLVFVSSASDFGIPAILAIPAGFSTVTTLIYSDLSFAGAASAISSAGALSALLGLIAIVLLVTTNRVARSSASATDARETAASSRPLIALGRLRAAVAGVCGLFVFCSTMLPLVGLFLTSVSPNFQIVLAPGRWVASAYAAALSGANIDALARSVALAAAAGVVVAIGGALVAVVVHRSGQLSGAAATLLSLPFALPGSVVAIAFLVAWQRWLYGSVVIIFLAYVARFAVVGVRTSAGTLGGLSEDLLWAARVGGATRRRAFFDVVWPALVPGMVTSFTIVFLLSIHELTMSSLLYGPQTKTFAVEVLAAEQAGEAALTAALAIVVTAITVLVLAGVLFVRSSRRVLASGARMEVPAWQG